MKLQNSFWIALFLLVAVNFSSNATGDSKWQVKYQRPKCFIENKGQFHLPNSSEKVLYAYDNSNTRIYFTAKGISYSFLKVWQKGDGESEREKEREEEKEREKEKDGYQNEMAAEEWKEKEAQEHRFEHSSDFVNVEWVGSNPNVQIIAEQKIPSYFSFSSRDNTGKISSENENFVSGFEKITYKDLYPNIDVEYVFHPTEGIKYSIILRPGADPSVIKMKYPDSEKLSLKGGDIRISTLFGKIIDHAPTTFYGDDHSAIISSKFVKTNNIVSFDIGSYDNTKTLVIDPWTVTPAFATNWDCVWECEKDGAGNVYIIGGVMPMQLLKYNSAGALQWTYSTPYDTTSWLGTFATDNAGASYVTLGSTAEILKVSTAGALVWSNPSPGGGILVEFWSIAFNCDQTQLVIGGTGGSIPPKPYIYNINTSTGNVASSVQVHGGGGFTGQEIRAITSCGNGKYFYLSHDTIGYVDQNFSFCPTGPGGAYHRNNQYTFGYKCENFRKDNTGICAIRANTSFVYTHRGNQVDKRSLVTANILTSAPIAGGAFTTSFGSSQVEDSGIDIDACGNVYVGSKGSVVKYDANLVLLATYPVSFNVYDVHVNAAGDIIACGSTGNSGTASRTGYIQSIPAGACAPLALTCCNPSICGPTSMCSSAPSVTLQGATAGGTWSGTGVTAGGVFNPAVSGPGTFVITYTLACGSSTLTIVVSPCSAMTVCQSPGPVLTVSGGTGPFTWQNQVTTNPCIAGFAFCSGAFTTPGPPVTSWSTFATGTSVSYSGTYPIQIVDNNGTILSIPSLASIPNCASSCPPMTINITSQVNVACFGASTGSFSASTTGGASPWDYTLMNGATTVSSFTNIAGTQSFTGLPAGTYTLNVLDNNGCPVSTTITITQPAAPTTTANAGPAQTVCGTTATLAGNTPTVGTGTWTLTSGAGTITTPSSPTSGITGLGVGPNVFTWTISNPPCPSTTSTVTITGVAAPTTSNAGPAQTICGTTATLAGNTAAVGTGTWTLTSGAGTITTPSSPTSGITGLGVGPNVFTWTISNPPCPPSSSTVTITGVAAPTTSNAGPAQTVCGTTATLAGNTATVGTGTWTLTSGAGTITTPSSPTSGITGLGVGANVFTWTITNAPCPPSTSTVTITGVTAPTVSNAGPNQSLCSSSATLAGNTPTVGTGTWTLTSGAGTVTTPSSPTSGVTGLGAGANVFTWTITNAPCPPSSSTVTITNTGGATTSVAGPPQTVCSTTATLAGNTPTTGTGLWTLVSGAGTITTPTSPTSGITGLGVGPNVFDWTISSPPCTPSSSTVTITGVAAPTTSNAGPNQSLCSSSATLAGNTPTVGTGTWTLVSGAGTITTPTSPTSGVTGLGLGPNVFQWTIDNSPCPPSTSTVTITNTGGATTSVAGPAQTVCGTTATLAGNTPTVGTGLWTLVSGAGTVTTPTSPTSGITGLGVGPNVFDWTISNPPCAPSSSTVTITGVAAPTVASAGSAQTVCSTSATLAGNTPTVGTGTWTLVSGAGTITTPSSPTSGVTGLGVGPNVFQWTISNSPCPPSTSTVTITNTGGPTANITAQTNILCFGGTTGSTTVTASGGSGGYTYNWTPGTPTGDGTPTITNLTAGTYSVDVTDGGGCTTGTTVTITQPASALTLALVTSANATCGNNNGSATVSASGGTVGSGYSYSWAPSGGSAASASGLGAGTYTVTATDANGCTAVLNVIINSSGGPTLSISSQTNNLCNGATNGSATISAVGGSGTYTYSWTGGGGSAATATNLAAGTYTVTVNDGVCSAIIVVTITQPSAISGTVNTTPANCSSSDGTASITASGGTGSLTYLWTPGGAITSSLSAIPTGVYSVVVTDSLGCTQTFTGSVGSVGSITANAGTNVIITQGDNIQLNASGGTTYTWSPGAGLSCTNCPNPIASPTQSTLYCVTVDSAGCSDSACVKVDVVIPCPTNTDLAVPNAFSPNDDGHNDAFCLQGWGNCIVTFTIYIYDRWGEKVFESSDANFCWDGKYKGKPLDPAVFVYFIVAEFNNDNKIDKKGNISLIR